MKTIAIMSVVFLITIAFGANTQEIVRPENLNFEINEASKTKVLVALDDLFAHIEYGTLSHAELGPKHIALTAEILEQLRAPTTNDGGESPTPPARHLINMYPVSENRYFLSIAQIDRQNEPHPAIRMILNLVAEENEDGVRFTLPLGYLTRHWKSRTVGRVTYHFRDTIDIQRAERFDAKNAAFAKKLGVEPETFDFYMCENYQEIIALLGYEYDADSNGTTRDGYGVVAGTIFAIMNNEDFSHDIFHYYSGQINELEDRNGVAEEGVAYSWGNAYYTDPNGEMIEQGRLVAALNLLIAANPNEMLLELFEQNQKIFPDLAPEASALSTMSSLICDEVERAHGLKGLMELVTSGRKDPFDRYFETADRLIGINRSNFEARMRALIREYR